MKTISSIAAMVLIAVVASPAMASEQVPFKGSFASLETYEVQGTTLFVDGTAAGNATFLGRYTATYEETVDLLTGMSVGSITLVAANGDSIFATQTGLGVPTPDPNIASIVEVSTITDGTGRFAGTTGTFTIERLVDLTTGLSSGSFSGTISNPGTN